MRIAEQSTGFLYMVSVTGITGERRELPEELLDRVAWLRERTPLPICVGFGISYAGAGKASRQRSGWRHRWLGIVRWIAKAAELGEAKCVEQISEFVRELHKA